MKIVLDPESILSKPQLLLFFEESEVGETALCDNQGYRGGWS